MTKELKKGKAFIILDAFMESVPLNEDALEKRAWRTIRKLIEDKGDINKVRKFFSALVDVKSEEIHRLRELKKPKVSKEFVENITREIVEGIFNREEYIPENSKTEKIIRKMLQEVGVEVEDITKPRGMGDAPIEE